MTLLSLRVMAMTRLIVALMFCGINAIVYAQSSVYSWFTVTPVDPFTIEIFDRICRPIDYSGGDLRAGVIESKVRFVSDDIPKDAQPVEDQSGIVRCTNAYGRVECESTDPVALFDLSKEGISMNENVSFETSTKPSIRRGGRYTYQTTFSGIGYEYSKVIEVIDDPSVRMYSSQVGKTQDYRIALFFNTGYPYDASQFTGTEKARATLYAIADGTATELASEEKQLSLCRPDQPLVAAVDTIEINPIALAPGKYRVTVTSDWTLEDANSSFDFEVIDTETAIQPTTMAEADDKANYDLQGRRLPVGVNRKGLRIQSRRKMLTYQP